MTRLAVYAAAGLLLACAAGTPTPFASFSSGLTAASSSSVAAPVAPGWFVSASPAAEIDDEDDDEGPTRRTAASTPSKRAPGGGSVALDDDDNVADLLADDDEFEGAAEPIQHQAKSTKKPSSKAGGGTAAADRAADPNEPSIQNVLAQPASFFQPIGLLEYLGLAVVLIYIVNYFVGRATNGKLAALWTKHFRQVFEDQFAFIGTDPAAVAAAAASEESQFVLLKESEHCYKLYASGRRFLSGCLVTLDLQRRQDLFSSVLGLVDLASRQDTMTIECAMNEDEVENFAFAVVKRKAAKKWQKECDPDSLLTVSKSVLKPAGLEAAYAVLNELPELEADLLTERVTKVLAKAQVERHFLSAHVSDQITLPWTTARKVVTFVCQLPTDWTEGEDGPLEAVQLATKLAFHLVDIVGQLRLTPAAKARSEARRKKLAEASLKASARERQEAQARKKQEQRQKEKEIMEKEPTSDLAKELMRKEEARKAKLMKKAQGRNVKVMR